MRRFLFLGAVLPFFYIIGVVLIIIELEMIYGGVIPGAVRAAILHAACWLAPMPLAFWAMTRVRGRSILALAAACLASAFAGEALFATISFAHGWYSPRDVRVFGFQSFGSTTMQLAGIGLQEPLMFTAAVLTAALFLYARDEERDRELRASRLDARHGEARLRLLRSQLNPHFLFNALNSVLALVRHDATAAEQMLDRLSRFYRITAQTEGRSMISVGEELAFVAEYLQIEQIRFGARLRVEIGGDVDAFVPALLLQPLVENAVKHGVARTPGPAWIHVRASRDDASLRLTVVNSGRLESAGEGVGLAATRERLRQAYGSAFTLRIDSLADATRVTIAIPLGEPA